MTSLRTAEGCNLQKLILEHGFDLLKMNQSYISDLIATDKATMDGSQLRLTRRGRLIADKISGDLFTD